MDQHGPAQQRRLHVLRAIVEDYVHSREPVGSKALVERHGLGVSAATIRNDMAALEDEGLISAPHTSAGRVPTEKGYRHFVDRIEEVKPLSPAERRAIRSLMEGADELDQVLARTVRLLSQLTQQVAVVQVPRIDDAGLRHVELVTLGEGQLLIVLITTAGAVRQRVVPVGPGVDEALLTRLRDLVLATAAGQRLERLPGLLTGVPVLLPPVARPAAVAVVRTLVELAEGERPQQMVLAGTAHLARSSEDFSGSITPVLETLEEQVVMLRLLSEMEDDAHGVAVRIGSENPHATLAEASVVATGYGPGHHAMVGVLGPTRMDYPGSIAAVRAVARYLSRILSA